MTEQEIERLFKGKNFVTPNIIKHGECGNNVYELSFGTDPMETSKKMYGVTVLTKDGKRTSLSRVFHTYKDAVNYIKGLQCTD